jgi:DNA polymerase III delta prime subunit
MELKQQLFWERFRPNTLVPEKGKIPIILLPRIRKIVEKELQLNLMLVSSGGQGKSTMARILAESHDTLILNCSSKQYRGIDVISEVIEDHIINYSISFKKNKRKKGDVNGEKCVILEEFDATTPDMRKALRGFMEEYTHVRFIACLNNLSALQRTEEDKALVGRFNIINFDAENKEEIDYLKHHQLNYLKSICRAIKFEVSDDVLMSLITRKFPNFRATVQLLQEIFISGDLESYLKKKDNINEDIFTFILNKENKLNENFFYVSDNFPKEKTEDLLRTLSRPFFKYLLENHEDIVLKNGFKLLDLSKTYNAEYTITIDPEMHLVDYITKLKQILNS